MEDTRIRIKAAYFGALITNLRTAHDWSVREAAETYTALLQQMFNTEEVISPEWLWALENGNIASIMVSRVVAMAAALHVTVSRLLSVDSILFDDLDETKPDAASQTVLALRDYGLDPKGVDMTIKFVREYKAAREALRLANQQMKLKPPEPEPTLGTNNSPKVISPKGKPKTRVSPRDSKTRPTRQK